MSVTKTRQAAGSFNVTLSDNTPRSVLDAVNVETKAFSQICVLPAAVDTNDLSAASIRTLSIFTGVVRTQADLYELGGAHASIWLGDEDGKGDLLETTTGAVSKSFVNWVAAIKPAQLSSGTVTATGANQTYTYWWNNPQASSPRQALDTICTMYSAEWEVTDDLKLNAGTSTAIYGSTPTVIATPLRLGSDPTYFALRADIKYTVDVEDYNTRTLLAYSAGTAGVASTNDTSVYTDGLGAALVWKRRIESSETTNNTAAGLICDSTNARFNQTRKALDVRTDLSAVMADVRVGTYIYAYDPERNVYDLNNPIYYRGELIYPLSTRVESITMPLTQGLGIYHITGGGTVTDLTRFIEWESPGATLKVGAPRRKLANSFKVKGLAGV